jgi:hypothetical protein
MAAKAAAFRIKARRQRFISPLPFELLRRSASAKHKARRFGFRGTTRRGSQAYVVLSGSDAPGCHWTQATMIVS